MGTTATVHRRKLPKTGNEPSAKLSAAKTRALELARKAQAKANAAAAKVREGLASGDSDSATAPARVQPSPALATSGALDRPVRAATAGAFAVDEGNFAPDPVIARLTERAAHPMAAPSWKSFRMYVTNHPDISELHQVGLRSMMEAHQSLRLALAAVAASVVLLLAALLAYWWLMPATADADSPYATADTEQLSSTAADQWETGVIPSLYQSDPAWGATVYGQGTMADTGAAPTALAMTYVAVTGDDSKTPADFAAWATDHDATAAGTDTITSYLAGAAADFGLALEPVELDAHALRHAIVSNVPVIVVTQPGTFSPVASAVVLDDIDKDSRIVLHDPSSAARSAKSWDFDDITNAAASAWVVTAA